MCRNAASYCGILDQKYPDKKAMGFPFDRPAASNITSMTQFTTPFPNMKTNEIRIQFQDQVIRRYPQWVVVLSFLPYKWHWPNLLDLKLSFHPFLSFPIAKGKQCLYFTWNFLTKRMVIYVIVFYEKKKMFEGVRFSWEKGLNNLYLFSIQHCLFLSNDPPFSVHISMVDEFSRIYQRISSSRPTFNHVQLLDTFGFISLLRFFDCFLSANAGNQIKKYTRDGNYLPFFPGRARHNDI